MSAINTELNPHDLEFSRNLGFMTLDEQQRLNNSTVAIAGAGGDGGMLAVQLARMGVGHLKLADPDPFEVENINRQACCTQDTIGANKAEAVGQYVRKINPSIEVELFTEGINPENTDEFVEGSDLVIDETEFSLHALGVMLARSARMHDVPDLIAMNIGFGATVTSFDRNSKIFEEFLGLRPDMPMDEIVNSNIPLSRWVPHVPSYADLDVFSKVASGEKSAPSIAPGVVMAAGIATTQAALHLIGGKGNNRPRPVLAPRVMMVDAYTGKSKIIKRPVLSHYMSLARVVIKNKLQLSPKTSY